MKNFALKTLLILATMALLGAGGLIIWASMLTIPDLGSLNTRKVAETTKIYARDGETLLYNLHEDTHRTVVPSGEISKNVKNATVAIEDDNFYEHFGISITDILRAVLVDITSLNFKQGGSTLTQQVIKNALLSSEKKISRKLKEWILAIKLDQQYSKEKILTLYLNEVPYGGNIYGVEEASRRFFGKPSSELTVAESAYLAALPKAPTYYSPYGNHKDGLDHRKNLVLSKMLKLGFINKNVYQKARKEGVEFKSRGNQDIKAPHFVMYIKQKLAEKYGEETVRQKGFKVITTLDYDLQEEGQKIVKERALKNAEKHNARNAGLIAIDPQTGQILSMVGSRNYFSKEINGNFNVTTAHRQPGSAFKPFAYATAINEGYTPETVVFDLHTQFSTNCSAQNLTSDGKCYAPVNYDGKFRGPVTFREALAQSINVPSVKALYLTGLKDSFDTARNMGIKNLTNPQQYGLTLVLGGGEVSLLNLTSAYGVFANEGIRHEPTGILKIKNKEGKTIESYNKNQVRVIPKHTSLAITDILSDNEARAPAFGYDSPLHFKEYDVAAKTGTTNNYKDAWTVGYSPNLAVGVWAGNNNNESMKEKVAGYIVAPMWHDFTKKALEELPKKEFEEPEYDYSNLKPRLRGIWQGNESYYIEKTTGKLATEDTPEGMKEEKFIPNVHSILYWVDKENPRGPKPDNPGTDSQFSRWEYPVEKWKEKENIEETLPEKPEENSTIHSPENKPEIDIISPKKEEEFNNKERVEIKIEVNSEYEISQADFYLDNQLLGSSESKPFSFSFIPQSLGFKKGKHTLKVVVQDKVKNKSTPQKVEIIINE